jgi:hypothetical protein
MDDERPASPPPMDVSIVDPPLPAGYNFADVRDALRDMGHPVTLFGESSHARLQRLYSLLNAHDTPPASSIPLPSTVPSLDPRPPSRRVHLTGTPLV